jgi:hypothetical protein
MPVLFPPKIAMKVRSLPIFLMLISAMTGCAHLQPQIPPNEDRKALTAAIASKGEGSDSPGQDKSEPPDKNAIATVVRTSVHVAETCAVVSVFGAFVVAAAVGHSSLPGGNPFPGVDDVLKKIWSDEL